MDLQSEIKRRARRRRLLATRRYRSRRFWRTISRRRKMVGLISLLLLVGMIYTAFYFTRPRRVERLAEEYLTQITGSPVKIADAVFSPLEGIRLQGLKVLPPQGDPRAVHTDYRFVADEVLLELEPLSLLTARLKVRRIVAVRPELVQVEYRKLRLPGDPPSPRPRFDIRQALPTRGWDIDLPTIELREGRYLHRVEWIAREDDKPAPPSATTRPESSSLQYQHSVNLVLRPDPQVRGQYLVSGRAGRAENELIGVSGTLTLNPFEVRVNELVVKSIRQLPEQIEKILARYQIDTGSVRIDGSYNSDAGELAVQFTCANTSMTLPLSQLRPGRPGAASGPDAGPASGRDGPVEALESIQVANVTGQITVTIQNDLLAADQAHPPDADDDAPPRGVIRFGRPDAPLRGRIDGQPFDVFGQYNGFAADADFDLHLRNEKFVLPQDPTLLARLPRAVWQIYDRYHPSGTIAVQAHVQRRTPGGQIEVSGAVQCLDMKADYWRYPYPADKVTGRIEFTHKQVTLDLLAHRGEATVQITGWGQFVGHKPMDLRVRGRSLPVDPSAYAALSVKHQKYVDILRTLNLSGGTVDFDCRVRRADQPDASYDTDVSVSLHEVNACYDKFPYPARVLAGEVTIDGEGVRLSKFEVMPAHVSGADRTAALLMDGYVGRDDLRLNYVSRSLPLDETLWRAMPESAARELLKYHIDARGQVVGEIRKQADQPLHFEAQGKLISGYLKYDGFPYAVESLAGNVRVTPRAVELIDTRGQHGVTPVTAVGRIGLRDDEPTRLMLHVAQLPLDGDVEAALPETTLAAWKKLRPAGVVGLDVSLTQPAAPEQGERPPLETVVSVTAMGNSVCYEDFPYPLAHVTGQIVIRPDRIELKRLVDVQDQRRIELSGSIWPDRDNSKLAPGQKPLPRFDLKVTASNVAFDETLRRAAPWRLRRYWNDIRPTGQFDLALKQFRYTPLGETGQWDVDGRLDLRDASGKLGVEVKALTGRLVGRGTIIPGHATGFVGQLDCDAATVFDRRISRITARLVQDATKGQLRLDNLTARCYGGQLSGFAEIGGSPGESDTRYALSLAARDLDLGELVNDGRAEPDRWKVAGRLDGRVTVEGKMLTGARRGRGELLISQAQMYQLPPVLAMLTGSNLKRPNNANQSANILFYLDGDRMIFEEANVRDPSLSLLGTGTMDLASKALDLTFVAGEPSGGAGGGARLIEELLSGAGAQLMRYRIAGPISKLKTEAQPLPTVRKAIDELTQARRQYQKKRSDAADPRTKAPAMNTAPTPGIPPSTPGRTHLD